MGFTVEFSRDDPEQRPRLEEIGSALVWCHEVEHFGERPLSPTPGTDVRARQLKIERPVGIRNRQDMREVIA